MGGADDDKEWTVEACQKLHFVATKRITSQRWTKRRAIFQIPGDEKAHRQFSIRVNYGTTRKAMTYKTHQVIPLALRSNLTSA
ncbi:hypothetical protein B9Z55_015978 [Caenorhabditis nigoni]|nr:hypothetical protein B9Z55_015978 [Caenorhabditis nigoni]